jgi:hypothetical protein
MGHFATQGAGDPVVVFFFEIIEQSPELLPARKINTSHGSWR